MVLEEKELELKHIFQKLSTLEIISREFFGTLSLHIHNCLTISCSPNASRKCKTRKPENKTLLKRQKPFLVKPKSKNFFLPRFVYSVVFISRTIHSLSPNSVLKTECQMVFKHSITFGVLSLSLTVSIYLSLLTLFSPLNYNIFYSYKNLLPCCFCIFLTLITITEYYI
jgi:hypothetical protein